MAIFTWALNAQTKPRQRCVIEFKGKFFDGKIWIKNKEQAKVFDSCHDAWNFIDTKLDPKGDHEEDLSLHTI